MASNGIFTVKTLSNAITNYQVWVSVFNTMIWGNGDTAAVPIGYLLDISIISLDPYVPPFSPVFSEELATDVFINLSESSDFVTYQLPSAYQVADDKQTITVTVNDMESFMTYNPIDNTIVVDVSNVDPN